MKTIKFQFIFCIFFISTILLTSSNNYQKRKTLILAADYWCPYNCLPSDQNQGYLVELVRRALYIYGVDIEYRMMPWSVALIKMEAGEIDGLIGISYIQNKNLLTTRIPLENSTTATFSRTQTKWVYDGIDSLKGKKLGIIMDYVLDESISHYVAMHYYKDPNNFVIEDGELAVIRSIDNLVNSVTDIYVEDRRVVNNYAKTHDLDKYIKDTGKVGNTPLPVYIVFSKNIPKITKYIKNLEDGIESLKASGEYEELRRKYNMDSYLQ